MFKAIIIDHEIPSLALLSYQLHKTKEFDLIEEYSVPTKALERIPILKPDVIFSDIEMPVMNGIALAETLRKMKIDTPIIFVSAHQCYAYDAFRVNAFHYLLKPFSMNELKKTLDKLKTLRINSELPAIIKEQPINTNTPLPKRSVYIKLFGRFEVINSKGESIKWSSKKTKELYAYFILHKNQHLDKWMIGEALWPEHNDKQVSSDFHTTLHRLRSILSHEHIDFSIGSEKGKKHGYIYEPGEIDYDIVQFDKFLAKQLSVNDDTIYDFERIRQLFQGELLSDIESFWCIPLRQKYTQAMLSILNAIGAYYTITLQYDKAYQVYMQSLELDYSCEVTHQKVLEILFLQKDKKGLMNHYKKLKEFTKKDMGAEPEDDTIMYYKQYLKNI